MGINSEAMNRLSNLNSGMNLLVISPIYFTKCVVNYLPHIILITPIMEYQSGLTEK